MGFSWEGILLDIVMLLPSIVSAILPPQGAPALTTELAPVFAVLERAGQVGCVIVLALSRDALHKKTIDVWFVLMALCLVLYYTTWVRYFAGGRNAVWLGRPLLGIPIPLAVLPIGVFAFAAIWAGSPWLALATAVLAAGHIPISWHTLR